jgi:hypothetical protein
MSEASNTTAPTQLVRTGMQTYACQFLTVSRGGHHLEPELAQLELLPSCSTWGSRGWTGTRSAGGSARAGSPPPASSP